MPKDNAEKERAGKFNKCPGCGSEELFFKSMLEELKNRGLIDEKITSFDFQTHSGVTLPQDKIMLLPFGSEIPAFKRLWDTCCNCGMIFSTSLETGMAKKGLEVASPPNRAERRRMEHFNPNNPLTS